MRVPLWLAAIALIIALAFIGQKMRAAMTSASNLMRRKILQLDPSKIESCGIEATGVVIDSSDVRGTATLIVLGPHAPEGAAALYFSSSGEMASRQERTDVIDISNAVLQAATEAIPFLVPGVNDEFPMNGMTRIHVLASSGWRRGDFATAQLCDSRDPLYPVVAHASELIAQLKPRR